MTVPIEVSPLAPLERRPTDSEGDGITLGQITSTLWRRRAVLLSTVLLISALGFVVVKLLTPTYTALTVIVLSARQDSVVDLEQSYMHLTPADAVVRSEADALQSRTLVDRVIDRENLMDDPEFNLYAQPYQPNLITRWGLADYLPHPLQSLLRSKPLDPSLLTADQLKYNVATRVLKAWDVEPDAKTYTVKCYFTSVDAEKAARIANAFTEEYLKFQIDERVDAANRAAKWLNTRLTELSQKVEQADRAVQAYREANNIVDLPSPQAESSTIALQQVQNMAQELAVARHNRADLEAAHRELQELLAHPEAALSAPSVASAPLVENVRIQEVTAAAHLAELTGTYGERHPLVLDAKNALQKIRDRLSDAVKVAVKQLEVQMRQAQASEAQLQARLDALTKVRNAENRVMPRLRQLESEQAAAKALYDTFVQGIYRSATQDGVPTATGRIVQYADVVDWPTFPNIPIFMAVIFIAGAMIAVGMVYVLEAGDKSFRSAQDLEEATQVPVLGLSLLARNRLPHLIGRRPPVSQRILAQPSSALSENVRLVRTAITLSRGEHAPKVVMLTSAVPGEGKTTFALMLARLSAAAGKRVLVIEAEMRKPTFDRELKKLPPKGLAEYLLGRATLDEVVGLDEESGAHFIAVRERSRFPCELLGSTAMAGLLNSVASDYDLILLDTPPVTIAADALELGPAIDSAVLIVKWGSTPRHLVEEAARRLRSAKLPLAGIVMTQVDARRYRSYGHGELPSEYARGYYALS